MEIFKGNLNSVVLLPGGSANEKKRGISHLFEHLFIANLFRNNIRDWVSGFTREDYIIILIAKINLKDLLTLTRNIKIEQEILTKEKDLVLNEIQHKKNSEAELFFNEVWRDTKYSHSPLGNISDLKNITIKDIVLFKEKILNGPIFLYSKNEGLSVHNKKSHKEQGYSKLRILKQKRRIFFRNNHYIVTYCKGEPGIIYLASRIISLFNPNSHIQVSEKKDLCALIMEEETKIPTGQDIYKLIPESLLRINEEVKGITNDFREVAINELESYYFYKKPWTLRIQQLASINEIQIVSLLNQLKNIRLS